MKQTSIKLGTIEIKPRYKPNFNWLRAYPGRHRTAKNKWTIRVPEKGDNGFWYSGMYNNAKEVKMSIHIKMYQNGFKSHLTAKEVKAVEKFLEDIERHTTKIWGRALN